MSELNIPYPLEIEMKYAARYGETDPMNVIAAMYLGIELRDDTRKMITYHDAHDLKSKDKSAVDKNQLIERSRKLSVPASIIHGKR